MFFKPIFLGDRVLCKAQVNRVFVEQNHLEVGVRLVRKSLNGVEEHALSAYFLICPAFPVELKPTIRKNPDEERRCEGKEELVSFSSNNLCQIYQSSSSYVVAFGARCSQVSFSGLSSASRQLQSHQHFFSHSCQCFRTASLVRHNYFFRERMGSYSRHAGSDGEAQSRRWIECGGVPFVSVDAPC